MVYGICRSLLRDPHDAEDATQQAFLSAYRALLGGARIRDDGAWLATIARNECRARIAAGMRAPLPIAGEDLEMIPAPTDEAERSAQAEELRSAIVDLPERQREAVVLRHLYGLSYGEVATALGLSRPATEALLFRARRAMRLRLRPAVATAIAVPLAVQEGLAQAIPGFAVAGTGGVVAGAAGGGLLAKLASGSVAAKLATAAVAVTTVGAVGTVESERAGRDRAERSGLVTNVGSRVSDDDSSGPGHSGRSEDERDRSGSSGPGGDDDSDDDGGGDDGNSGKGSSSSGSSGDDDREVDDDSGSGGSGEDDEPSGNSGSGSDDEGGSGSESDDDGGGEDPSEPDDSSGSSESGSSGSGSGGDTTDETDESDSSGHGSGSDDKSGSSGSGSSGSGGDADDADD